MKNLNLFKSKGIEKKLFVVYHEDGILDLVIGITILSIALLVHFDQDGYIGLIAIPIISYIPLKQKISYPRIGLIRFNSEKEQKRQLSLSLVLGLTTFIGLIVFYIFSGDIPENIVDMLRANMPLVFGAVLGLILWAVAKFMNNSRFYVYAFLAIVFVWLAHFTGFGIGVAVMMLGGIVEAVSIFYLINFLRTYPIANEGK